MEKTINRLVFIVIILFISMPVSSAELEIGSDVCSRYVWRGTDFGNSPAIQPYISLSAAVLELGAWSSWSFTGAPGGNENDLYVSYSFGNCQMTVTDYFFPSYSGDDGIDDFSNTGGHTLELSGGCTAGKVLIMGAFNFLGNDPDHSKYIELSYNIFDKDGISAAAFMGAGDHIYTSDNSFTVVNIGLIISRDSYSASYMVNPDVGTSFLVFMISI